VTRALHLALALSLLAAVVLHSQQSVDDATARAVKYLVHEVPRWHAEEGCYSCHNNGDAARALMAASATDPAAVGAALADTFTWLADPPAWNRAVVNRGVDNKILARIQFAAALTDAVARGDAPAAALAAAADMVAADQEADGFWRVDTGDNVGSPVTYGAALATAMALKTLVASERAAVAPAIARARAWLIRAPLRAVPDAAGMLLGLPRTTADDATVGARRRAADKLFAEQDARGGWGPFATVTAEPFDTALAILALQTLAAGPARDRAIASGRAWLRTAQYADGSWPETTRPAGQVSYAQSISTTGWCLLALTESGPGR